MAHTYEILGGRINMQHLFFQCQTEVKNDHNIGLILTSFKDTGSEERFEKRAASNFAFAKIVLYGYKQTSRYRPDTRQHPGL